MHIDEDKKFDKRNIAGNIKNGVITQREYESYLSKLPDASTKLFNAEEISVESGEVDPREVTEASLKKKTIKKKAKGKGK